MIRRTCTQFKGANAECGAGIHVESVRDDEQRLPCHEINGITSALECDERVWPPTAAVPPPGRMRIALERVLQNRCPTCDQPMTGERELGGKRLATPCGHVLRSKDPA